MEQLFVNLEKARYGTKGAVRTVLASKHPEMEVQAILDSGDTWFTRLVPKVAAPPSKLEDSMDDLPALPGEEDEGGKPEKEVEETPEEEASEDESKEEKDGEDKGDKEDKPKKDKKPKDEDLSAKVDKIIGELQDLLEDLGGTASELKAKHDEKADKLDQIGDLAGGDGPKGDMPSDLEDIEDTPEEIGPTPGGPPMGMDEPLPVPTGPKPAKGFDKRKKPAVGVPAFTNSKMVSTPLFKDNGEKVTVATAINRIYGMEKYAAYEVYGIQPDEDENRYIVHLILKDN